MAYQFRLPLIVDLTADQQAAVYDDDEFCLKGGPGTGKTVVSLWRHLENWERKGKRSLLLTYTKSLAYYLQNTAKSENSDAGNAIDRTFRWVQNPSRYDEIIVDEAQDVPLEKYHIIKKYADTVCYGADERQSLYDSGVSLNELKSLFGNNEYELHQNFRNSREILRFVKSVFPHLNIDDSEEVSGRKPRLIDTNKNESKVKSVIEELVEDNPTTENLAILVPTQRMVHTYKSIVDSFTDKATMYIQDRSIDDISEISNIHVTTFKSSKGLEFDTVIIPEFQKYDWLIKKGNIPISENDYYVGMTRTRRNLFLLCDWMPSGVPSNTYERVNT